MPEVTHAYCLGVIDSLRMKTHDLLSSLTDPALKTEAQDILAVVDRASDTLRRHALATDSTTLLLAASLRIQSAARRFTLLESAIAQARRDAQRPVRAVDE